MTAVPRVGVYEYVKVEGKDGFSSAQYRVTSEVALPGVFRAPIRQDIVQFVHTNLSKNSRQARGVNVLAGMRHAAISWGPGRAVARVPRVTGSGSQRTGQAAFANMTRKGRMFAPLKTWRRWHRKVNVNQRRYAVCASLAASAVTPLVMARGHRVQNVPCLPLVVSDKFQDVEKTRGVVTWLNALGLGDDVQRCVKSKRLRAGAGKARNRRFTQRVGPLVVLNDRNCKAAKALRNVPGVDVAYVGALNLSQLAPGAHVGRLVVWTQSAFQALNGLYGTQRVGSTVKTGFSLQRSCLTNADVQRIINSNEVQSVVRDVKAPRRLHNAQKKNPLRNKHTMRLLNPYQAKASGKGRQFKAKARATFRTNGRKWMSGVQAKDQECEE